jgi:hypothetical protein
MAQDSIGRTGTGDGTGDSNQLHSSIASYPATDLP